MSPGRSGERNKLPARGRTARGRPFPSTVPLVTHDSLETSIIVPTLQIGKVKLMRLESLPQNKQISDPKHVIRVAGI